MTLHVLLKVTKTNNELVQVKYLDFHSKEGRVNIAKTAWWAMHEESDVHTLSTHRVQFKATFDTPYKEYRDRNGETFIVIGLAFDGVDLAKEGYMWRVRFRDGTEIQAWPEEIELSPLQQERTQVCEAITESVE